MKPRVKVRVKFGKPTRPAPTPETERVPRVARLLALAHYIDEKIRAGEIENLAAAAREMGITRPRMSQLADLVLLAPDIQHSLVCGAHSADCVRERSVRVILRSPAWTTQSRGFTSFLEGTL